MESLIFAVNAVTPIILMVCIGYLLKRIKLVTPDFAKNANRLVFRVFLPAMLFLNVYNIENLGDINFGFVAYAIIALLILFFASLGLVVCFTKNTERRGVLLQATFRSNYALIGIPLASSLFGEEGALIATLLSAFTIPMFNMLAVVSLSIFNYSNGKPSAKKILLGIVKNPLIQSIVLGIVMLFVRSMFEKQNISFRLSDIGVLFEVLAYLSKVATPLALLMLGAQFEFSAISSLKKEIIFGVIMRIVIAPLFGLGCAYWLFASQFGGAHFAAFVAMFATPVAVSSVPMAQEMGGDTELAGQLVVWTTLFSTASVFIASFLLKFVGIF